MSTGSTRPFTVHPSLQFISHIPHSITGEQLMNQFLRCIPDKTWLFKYGRVPLNLIMGEWVWQVSFLAIHPFLRFPFVSSFNLFRFLGFSSRSLFLHLDIKLGARFELHDSRYTPFHPVCRFALNLHPHLSRSGICSDRLVRSANALSPMC